MRHQFFFETGWLPNEGWQVVVPKEEHTNLFLGKRTSYEQPSRSFMHSYKIFTLQGSHVISFIVIQDFTMVIKAMLGKSSPLNSRFAVINAC